MASKKTTKVKAFSFKHEIAEKIEVYAKQDNRTISNYVETVLMREFQRIEQQQTQTTV